MHPSLYGFDQNWQAKYKEQCQLNSMGGEKCMKYKREVAGCQGFCCQRAIYCLVVVDV